MRGLLLIAVMMTLVWGPARAENCAPPHDTVLTHVNVVDVERGIVRKDRALVLSKGRIATEVSAIGLVAEIAPGAERVDGAGAFVIPGLWDMHVHTLWNRDVPEPFFRLFLRSGVTAVRDMGGDLQVGLETRGRIESCTSSAPHVWFPGPFLDGPQPVDPSLSIALSTPDEGRAAVKMLRGRGVDFIKVYSLIPPDVFDAVGPAPLGVILAAGVLVGFGTRRGGGCTSGHGVCGLSMLSARSLVATLVFMGVGMLTVFVTRHALHLPTGTP